MERNPRFEEDCRIGQQVRFLSYIDSDNHEAFRLLDRIVSFSEYSYSLRNDNGRLNEFGGQEQTLIYSSRSRSRGFSRRTLQRPMVVSELHHRPGNRHHAIHFDKTPSILQIRTRRRRINR